MRKLLSTILTVIVFFSVSIQSNAQTCTNVPVINSFEPNTGFIGSLVTIFGANFDSNNIQNNVVYFGSTKAEVISATFGTLEVIVPVGASTAPISVTNQCDRTAYSKVSFNGIFCPTPLDNQTYNNRSFDLTGVYGAYNMLSQDLDLDGKPEVVSSSNGGGLTIAINNSTPGVLNFTALNSTAGGQSIYAADFDGDGYKDLLSTYQVTRNTSTLGNVSMAPSQAIPRVSSYQIAAGDFNNDGKIDIVGEDGNIVWVAFNTSSGVGNISFGPRQSLGNVGTRCTGIQVADIDGDGKTDFIASQGPLNRAVSIRNTTAVGSMTPSAEAPEYWASDSNPNDGTGTYPYRAQIADFDKDGKIDFTSCNYTGNTNVAIWRNISTVGNIQFAPTVNLPAPTANYRIGVGDVDGDGYPDVVTKSLGQNVFSVYKNTTSAEGSPTFATRIDYTSSWQAEVSGIVIGDLDGDYVPDIATSGISSNRILFHRNESSQNDDTAPNAIAQDVVVALAPNGTVTVTAAQVNNGSSDACGIDSIVLSQTVFTCADIGENPVTLTVTDNAGNVSTAQAIVNVQPAAIIVAGQTTVCQGETIPLTANVGDSYQWFNNGQPIAGATSQNYIATISGAYTVAVTNAGGCSGTSLATEVTVNNSPVVEITGRTEAYCPGESLIASQSAIYQWFKNGNPVADATLREFFPDGPGVYTVVVIDLFGCSASGSVTINPDTQAPTIALNGAAQITVDSDTQFNDPSATAEDNCSTTIEVSSNLDLSTPGVYTVSYTAVDGSGNRSTTISREVTVLDATPPVVNAGRVTVELDENGQVTVDPASLNNGSTDNGNGALTFSLDRSTFDCSDLNGGSGGSGGTRVAMTSVGTKILNNYSVGASYNPNNGEYWMPEWAGTTVYRLDANGNVLGSFNSGQSQMMQLWIDLDSETEYYSANWTSSSPYYFSKRNLAGQEIWRYNVANGFYASGITTDSEFAYVIGYQGNRIDVLDKMTGQFQRSINLPGTIQSYGSLVVANEHIYFGGYAQGWSNVPNTWNAIHEIDLDGNYIGSISNPSAAYNVHFDGEVIWISDFGNVNYGYKISDGNAYAGGGGIEVLLTGTDAAGNSASAVGVVVVLDNLAPTVTLNGDQVVQVVTGSTFTDAGATASDNCSATVETTGSVNVNAAGSYTLTYKAIDGSGNESAEITRTVNVIDLVVNTKNITVELDQNGNYTLTPAEVDNGSVLAGGSLSLDITSFTCSNIGQNIVTLTATSGSGITATGTATVTVVDLIAPAIAINGNASLTHEAYTSYVDAGATTADNCSATLVTTSNVDVNTLGSYTVTYTSTDASGNQTTATRTVNVIDSVDPIALAKDVTVTLDDNGNASVSTTDVDNGSSDNSGSVSLSLSQTTFACSDFGNTVQVILTATDAAGNTSSANANITVTGIDTDGDGYANPCDLDDDNDGILDTIECSSSAFFWSNGPALQNPVNGLATSARGTINGIGYTYSSNVNFTTTGNLFGIQKFPTEFAIPNQTSIRNDLASQNTLTFDQPMTNPVLVFASIGGGPTVNIEFENDFDVLWIESGTTSVNGRIVTGKEGNIVLRFNGEFSSLSFDYLNAETYVNFAFGADFFSLCDFDEDGITNNLDLDSDNDGCADAVEGALGLGLAAINAEGRLIASVDANGVPTSANGGQGVGTSANASADCECELKIDQDAPVITAPANISVFATSAAGAVVNYAAPVGTDACDVSTVLTAGFGPGATFPIGTTTVTYTATDGSGNTASASFNVEVSGLAPEIVVPANITVENDFGICGAVVNFAATETVGIPASTITYDMQPGTVFGVGTTVVTASATNAVGTSTKSFSITVNDTQVPTITSPFDITTTVDAGVCGAVVNYSVPTATDNCGTGSAQTTLVGHTFKGER
uniref:immunoglobulin-like domain-containing protein n=1 Tax=Roseivirga sp. TaxID=1964215 RepID=UPI004056A8AD